LEERRGVSKGIPTIAANPGCPIVFINSYFAISALILIYFNKTAFKKAVL
jgi:hypothetical protein